MTSLILIEGPANSGKTTIAWKVYDELLKQATKVTCWAMNGEKRTGDEIRYCGGVLQDFYALFEICGRKVCVASDGDAGYIIDAKRYADYNCVDVVILCIRNSYEGDAFSFRRKVFWGENPQYVVNTTRIGDNNLQEVYNEEKKEEVLKCLDKHMGVELHRTFWPVGHGAFYTEKFVQAGDVKFTAVYDCGALSHFYKQGAACIDEAFPVLSNGDKHHIDLIFISHFHDDHVHFLDTLLKRCDNKVRIVAPRLTKATVVEAILYNAIQDNGNVNSEVNAFIISLFLGDDRLYNWNREQGEKQHSEGGTEEQQNIYDKTTKLLNGRPVFRLPIDLCPEWVYIPFNVKTDELKDIDLIKKLKGQGLDIEEGYFRDKDQLLSVFCNKSAKELRKIYQGVFGREHNAYSMPVFSGILSCFWEHWHLRYPWVYYYRQGEECVNCLYTGDFEPGDEKNPNSNICQMHQYFSDIWSEIGLLQVPHHGSNNNYSGMLYDYPRLCVASVPGNSEKHPGLKTMKGIVANECYPLVVNEQNHSIKEFVYYRR